MDDGLRLIYADWLEEHSGEARAEFIPRPDRACPPARTTTSRQWDLAEARAAAPCRARGPTGRRRCGPFVAPLRASGRGFVEGIAVNAQAPCLTTRGTIFPPGAGAAPGRPRRGCPSPRRPDAASRAAPLWSFAPDLADGRSGARAHP